MSMMAKSQLLNTFQEKGNRSPTIARCIILYFLAILLGCVCAVSRDCQYCVTSAPPPLSPSHSLDEESQGKYDEESRADQQVGQGELVAEHEVGGGVRGRGKMWLVLSGVIVAVEEDRVFQQVSLGDGEGMMEREGWRECEGGGEEGKMRYKMRYEVK